MDVFFWNTVYVPNLNAIEQCAAELLRFQCLTLWPWTCVTCCSRLWDNFHQVWPSTTYPYLNYSVFDDETLCYAVTLIFDLLTLNFYSTLSVMCLKFKLCTEFERNWIIHCWIIDDLARFRRAILGCRALVPNGSQGCVDPTSPNLART